MAQLVLACHCVVDSLLDHHTTIWLFAEQARLGPSASSLEWPGKQQFHFDTSFKLKPEEYRFLSYSVCSNN